MRRITYLGHSNFLISLEGGINIACDPWIIGNPSFPKDFPYPNIDFILLSHGHSDHSSNTENILKANKDAKLISCFELCNLFNKLYGVNGSQLMGTNVGGKIKISKDSDVEITNAIHSNSFSYGNETHYAGIASGFIIKDGDFVIYFAGDTSYFSDMKLLGEKYNIDVAILPIGSTFTMDINDAILATKALNAKKLIPMHYDTFPAIKIDVDNAKRLCLENKIDALFLQSGEEIDF